jgi:hypothetical protein
MSMAIRVHVTTTLLISLAVSPRMVHAQTGEATPTPIAVSASSAPTPSVTPPAPDHPAILMSLYGSFIGLQALDFDSTLKAIHNGSGREANPVMQSVVGSPVAFMALKGGATAAIIVACERLRRRHHGVAATALMIGLNSAYSFVVARNYAIANRPQ